MATESQGVLNALDTAKTQLYHFKAIVIAGMGFFTDAYDLFCITCVTKLLGRIYYSDKESILPPNVNNAVSGVALVGTLVGQLFFGALGDKLGRKRVYGVTLIIMVFSAIASGLSFGGGPEHRRAVMTTLCFFRFWLGFGIGGDYPLSATIMSEYANQKTRGAFIAAVFAMQGMGILVAGLFSMIVAAAFNRSFPAPKGQTAKEADFVWRIILMFGAVPALVTYYWRMKMPETARFTALVEGNTDRAVADMARVLQVNEVELGVQEKQMSRPRQKQIYTLFSGEFLKRHGRHLLGTATTWFLLDVAFYSNNLTQKDVYTAIGLVPKAEEMNGIEEVFKISKAQFLVALFGTVPGYWFTVFFIERLGRFIIQLMGFFFMSVFMLVLGIRFEQLRGHSCHSARKYCGGNHTLFAALYALTFFFANFGPNSTTFVLPAELFPARLRSTCHGISAAAGKLGAIFSAFWIQKYTVSGEAGKIKATLMALAVVNFVGFFFTFLVPETKGRSLEEISGENEGVDQPANGTDIEINLSKIATPSREFTTNVEF